MLHIYARQWTHVFCLRHSDTLEVYGSKINGRRYPIKFKTRSLLLKVLAESIKTSLFLTLITRKYNNIRSRWYIIWRYIFFRHILYENKKNVKIWNIWVSRIVLRKLFCTSTPNHKHNLPFQLKCSTLKFILDFI